MSNQKLPFVSVVVVTFNRNTSIKPCLDSLINQTYPKHLYEIIVVDDGSTDNTADIVKARGVRVVSHENNKGISYARNTGLKSAKGEIIAYIDDDAVADSKWLEYLIQPFGDPTITASGGQTLAYKTEYITERFLAAQGYGNPAPLAFGMSKNPLWRFWIYLNDMFRPIAIVTKPTEVQAVFGLNCAFRTSTLISIGGFDERLVFAEDSEISTRIREKGARIIFIPQAIIHHRHRENLAYLIRQTYRRSESLLYYYSKEEKALPIFPFPLLYIIIVIILSIIAPLISLLFIIFGPLIIYCWWPIRALRERRLEYFLYSYIQLMLELATILGLIRGKVRGI
jgi:glycosyltransferase involved in cell wall biosynthesis